MLSKIAYKFNTIASKSTDYPSRNNTAYKISPKQTQDRFERNKNISSVSFGSRQDDSENIQKINANLGKLKANLNSDEVNPEITEQIASEIKAGNIEKAESLLDSAKSKIKGNIIIVSGPSGVGKDTVIKELIQKHPEINTIVSHTTRLPREKDGEKDGVSYYFVKGRDDKEKEQKFKELIPDMLQWAKLGKFYYGSTRTELEKKQKGHDVCLNIYAPDAVRLKKELGNKAVTIFLEPGEADEKADLAELSRRILARNPMSTEELNDRLAKAKEQLTLKPQFDFSVSNPSNENKEATLAANEAAKDILSRRNPAFKLIDDIKEQLTSILQAQIAGNKEKKAA